MINFLVIKLYFIAKCIILIRFIGTLEILDFRFVVQYLSYEYVIICIIAKCDYRQYGAGLWTDAYRVFYITIRQYQRISKYRGQFENSQLECQRPSVVGKPSRLAQELTSFDQFNHLLSILSITPLLVYYFVSVFIHSALFYLPSNHHCLLIVLKLKPIHSDDKIINRTQPLDTG